MADGTQKNIENIQIGDIVKSYDINTNSIQKDDVIEVFHDAPNQMMSDYYIVINNDLKITPDHPVYINGQWISAENLKIGDLLFKGKINSLEKIYEKVPTYNFETEKYHTYLVVFGDNIIIAHNGRTYILTGNEEKISLSRQSSVTEDDYAALLSMDKIFQLLEMPYQELKDILGVSDEYEFSITIENNEAIYLNYIPDKFISLNSKNVVVTCKENVIIADSVGYAYATISVTVIK
jgi:intein/homing endonuclease